MPRRFISTTGRTRITCNRCGREAMAQGREWSFNRATVDEITGRPLHAIFYYSESRGRNDSTCRECQRVAAGERRARRVNALGRAVARALGGGRRFGVELELTFPGTVSRHTIKDALTEAGLGTWSVKSDGSLSGNGWEIVSPVLSGDDGEDQVRKACRILNRLDATVNRSCGLHAHHDITDLTIEQIRRLVRSWHVNQELIDGLVSESRRGSNNTYCRNFRDGEIEELERIGDLETLRHSYLERYKKLNLAAYGRFGTVEVRQHQGTCDAEKILTWVQFGQALIDNAKTAATPLPRTSRVRDLLTAIRLNESASAFLLGRAIQFNTVTA